MTIWEGISRAMTNNEYVNVLGWVFAAAMLVGGIIDGGWRKLANWIFAIVTGVILIEYSRLVYWSVFSQQVLAIQGSAITVIGVLINAVGILIGWLLAYIAKIRARGERFFPIHEEHNRRKEDAVDVLESVAHNLDIGGKNDVR